MPRGRKHTTEFKREAVALSHQKDRTVADVAEALGIHKQLLYRWRREFKADGLDAFPGKGHQTPEAAEITRLRKQVARLTEEREVLKKALTFFAQNQR